MLIYIFFLTIRKNFISEKIDKIWAFLDEPFLSYDDLSSNRWKKQILLSPSNGKTLTPERVMLNKLNWNAMLDMTKVELELISNADIYLLFEKSMKGEVSYIYSA